MANLVRQDQGEMSSEDRSSSGPSSFDPPTGPEVSESPEDPEFLDGLEGPTGPEGPEGVNPIPKEPQIKPRMLMGDTQSMNPTVMLDETCCKDTGVPEECMGLCRNGLHHHRKIMADLP